MKRKNVSIVISLIMLTTIILVMVDPSKQKETEPEFVLSYAENQTEDYPTTMAAYKFSELVEERTDGRIKILVQAEGQLGDENSVIQQMQYGGVDFARVSLTTLAEYMPELMVLFMPYLYKDSKHMWKVLDGDIGSEYLASIEASGVVGISWYDAGARSFYNAVKPITSLEDMEGLTIRVQESSLMVDTVQALGAKAVTLEYSEVYSAIEQGLVDGAENNWPSYEAMNHYEVAWYYTLDEHVRIPEVQLCSGVTWNKLSVEDQEIINACAVESALYERKLWAEREEESREIAISYGVEVTELTDAEKEKFELAVAPVYEKYCADYVDIVDAIKAEGED